MLLSRRSHGLSPFLPAVAEWTGSYSSIVLV